MAVFLTSSLIFWCATMYWLLALKDTLLLTSFLRIQRDKVSFSVSSRPHYSYQLYCPYLSGLINYYHIIFIWTKSQNKTVGILASGLFGGYLIHPWYKWNREKKLWAFIMRTLRYKETFNCVVQYQQSWGKWESYTFVWFLCLFITNWAILNGYVWLCTPACVPAFLH